MDITSKGATINKEIMVNKEIMAMETTTNKGTIMPLLKAMEINQVSMETQDGQIILVHSLLCQ